MPAIVPAPRHGWEVTPWRAIVGACQARESMRMGACGDAWGDSSRSPRCRLPPMRYRSPTLRVVCVEPPGHDRRHKVAEKDPAPGGSPRNLPHRRKSAPGKRAGKGARKFRAPGSVCAARNPNSPDSQGISGASYSGKSSSSIRSMRLSAVRRAPRALMPSRNWCTSPFSFLCSGMAPW